MRKSILAEIQNLNKAEVFEMIPKDTLERIKKTDKKPEFKVYGVGHEGVANAQELSFGTKVKKAFHYVKDMVLAIASKLQYGLPFFVSHTDANTSRGREQVGELVGKAVKVIQNRLTALAVAYIYPQYRKMPLDVASIEADVVYIPKSQDRAEVIDVEKITAVALGSSATDRPAFEGATLLGVIQAFTKERDEKMTKEEIIAAVREGSFKVTDIFSPEEITASEPAKKAKQTEYEHAKRIEKSLGEEREKVIDLTKKIEEADGKIKTLNQQVNTVKAGDLFKVSVEERKLNDKQKAFIERRLTGFKSEKSGEELKTDFNKFIDNEIKEFDEYAKMMGIKVDDADGKGKAGTPSSDGKEGDKTDLTDPKNNELIPEL